MFAWMRLPNIRYITLLIAIKRRNKKKTALPSYSGALVLIAIDLRVNADKELRTQAKELLMLSKVNSSICGSLLRL